MGKELQNQNTYVDDAEYISAKKPLMEEVTLMKYFQNQNMLELPL